MFLFVQPAAVLGGPEHVPKPLPKISSKIENAAADLPRPTRSIEPATTTQDKELQRCEACSVSALSHTNLSTHTLHQCLCSEL